MTEVTRMRRSTFKRSSFSLKSSIDVILVKIGAVYNRTEPTDIPFMLIDVLYRILNVPWQTIPRRTQESSVFRPMRNAFGPSKNRVITASRRKPTNSLRKLVYDDEEPCASISLTNRPMVPQRHPVMNILIKPLNSESMLIETGASMNILRGAGFIFL